MPLPSRPEAAVRDAVARETVARLAPAGPDATLPIYLSLFLIILAFFVLLNALSLKEKKRAQAVVDSIGESFTVDPRLRFGKQALTGHGDGHQGVAGLREIGTLFAAELAIATVTHVRPGEELEVLVPVWLLFPRDGVSLKPEREALLARIAQALRQPQAGDRYILEALISLSPRERATVLSSGQQAAQEDAIARAASLAHRLLAHNAPAESLTVGLENGRLEQVRLRFLRRPLPPARTEEPSPDSLILPSPPPPAAGPP